MSQKRCIYLVRHGETVGESSVRYHGRNDVPLSDEGRHQVSRLRQLVQHVRFASVIHSPLDRARESAQILIDGLHRAPDVVEEAPDLIEVDFGAIEGLTEAEIAVELPEWFTVWKRGKASGFPGGESTEGFKQRIEAAFAGLLSRHPDGNLLVVVHKGVIKRGLGWMLGLSPDAAAQLDPALGSLTVVSCGREVRLKHWNQTL